MRDSDKKKASIRVRRVERLKYNGGVGIASGGYNESDFMQTSNQKMNGDVSAMMAETKRIQTSQGGRRQYTDEEMKQASAQSSNVEVEWPTTWPLTTAHLYDEMKREQKHALRVSRRDHIKEINSAMMFSKAPKSMASTAFQFDDEWREIMKEKDYRHHFKWDSFKVYQEEWARYALLVRWESNTQA